MFKHYFLTGWLIAGLPMAIKLWKEGPLGMLVGFLAVAPLAAIFAIAKVAYDRRKARQQQLP
jgi:hypothetical protein